MGKAVFVMDNPTSCSDCMMISITRDRTTHESIWYCRACHTEMPEGDFILNVVDDIDSENKPDWCPLKPLPERELIWFEDEESDYERGFNACIEYMEAK